MKINISQTFDAPLDIVLRAKDERFNHTDKIAGLKPVHYKERKEDEKSITTHRDFEISMDKTPAPIRKMLPSEMFNMVEIAVWDKASNRHDWEMVSGAKNKLSWKGATSYVARGDKTERKIECTIKVNVPFIGDAIEQTMGAGFKKSMEKDFRTVSEMINLIKNGKV
jgi:hypothetical protein